MPRSSVLAGVPAIIVHGGAGSLAPARFDAARAGCERAVGAGLAVLRSSASALDAVQAAVRVLEDDPVFNAGIGAALTRDHTVELDASLMEGTTLRFGAVAAMPNARQPIDIARAVLDDGEHVLLCAEGAWQFARLHGFAPCAPEVLITERARQRLQAAALTARAHPDAGGTVGACAIDERGQVAAATSTGGTTFKRPGRIGDTPLCGCGTYADDRGGAASATGVGEAIIRVTMTRACVFRLVQDEPADVAVWHVVDELAERTGLEAGIVAVDRHGNTAAAHNTETMPVAMGRLDEDTIHSDVHLGRR